MASLPFEVMPLCDQVLTGGDEVVEHILLAGVTPAIVPRLAIFTAATDVGDREDSQPARATRSGSRRSLGFIETLKPP